MPTWDEDIVKAFENLGGSANYGALYAEIERIRPNLPGSWKSVVRRRVQDLSSDSAGFKGGKDLFFSVEGLGAGVWGLRSYLGETPTASDLPEGVEEPSRAYTLTYRVLRDTALARKIKVIHQDQCQICGMAVSLSDGKTYSEAHHIIPLGKPHNGSDVPGNIIVLCPNHHVLCDYGAIRLDLQILRQVEGHQVSQQSIDYHNRSLLGRPL
ncbi:HNH endonuclease [Marinospirillum perlucidum]|uniref:HNH endonuclease n=1 Tax=Marinospirillum perlucidum TaxID=1982602 RepID=UPI000DF19962|nr:HNH endonuclease [Marinospirillum perlucidum]